MTRGMKAPVAADGLTDREREVLVYLSKGYTLGEAADRMSVNPNTLRDSVRQIFEKLQASTQAEAVYRAVKEGMIP